MNWLHLEINILLVIQKKKLERVKVMKCNMNKYGVDRYEMSLNFISIVVSIKVEGGSKAV